MDGSLLKEPIKRPEARSAGRPAKWMKSSVERAPENTVIKEINKNLFIL